MPFDQEGKRVSKSVNTYTSPKTSSTSSGATISSGTIAAKPEGTYKGTEDAFNKMILAQEAKNRAEGISGSDYVSYQQQIRPVGSSSAPTGMITKTGTSEWKQHTQTAQDLISQHAQQQATSTRLPSMGSRTTAPDFYSNPANWKEGTGKGVRLPSGEMYYPQAGTYSEPKGQYQRVQEAVAGYITKPLVNIAVKSGFADKVLDTTSKGGLNFITQNPLLKAAAIPLKDSKGISAFLSTDTGQKLKTAGTTAYSQYTFINREVQKEYLKSYRDEPLTNVIMFGAGAGYGFGTSVVKATATGRNIIKGLNVGLAVVGTGATAITLATSENPYKTIGQFGAYGTSFGVGSYSGAKAYTAYENAFTKTNINYKISQAQYDYRINAKGTLKNKPYQETTFGSTQDKKSLTTIRYKDYVTKISRDFNTGKQSTYTTDLATGKTTSAISNIPKTPKLTFTTKPPVTINKITQLKQSPESTKSYVESFSERTAKIKGGYEIGRTKFDIKLNTGQYSKSITISTDQLIRSMEIKPSGEINYNIATNKPTFTFGKTKNQPDIIQYAKDIYPIRTEMLKVVQPRTTSTTRNIFTTTGKATYIQEPIKLPKLFSGTKGQTSFTTGEIEFGSLISKPEVRLPSGNFKVSNMPQAEFMPKFMPTQNTAFISAVFPKADISYKFKPISETTTVQIPDTKPRENILPATKSKYILDQTPKQTLITKTTTKTITQLVPTTTYMPSEIGIPPITPTPNIPFFTPEVPPVPPVRIGGGMSFGGAGGGHKKKYVFKIKQKRRYEPTLYSAGFRIKGKKSKIGSMSGLGIRPLQLKR